MENFSGTITYYYYYTYMYMYVIWDKTKMRGFYLSFRSMDLILNLHALVLYLSQLAKTTTLIQKMCSCRQHFLNAQSKQMVRYQICYVMVFLAKEFTKTVSMVANIENCIYLYFWNLYSYLAATIIEAEEWLLVVAIFIVIKLIW